MSVAAQKILGDVQQNWGRLVLLLVTVAIGQGVLTAALTSRSVLEREITRNFAVANAPEITLNTSGIPSDALASLRKTPGVAEIDTRMLASIRVRAPGQPWRRMILFGVRDFEDIRVSRLVRSAAVAAPASGEILLERSGLGFLGTGVGGHLDVQAEARHPAVLNVAGTVHDPALPPSWQEGVGYGYVPESAMAAILGPGGSRQLRITTQADAEPAKVARMVADAVAAGGGHVLSAVVAEPAHPHIGLMRTMLGLFAVFSVLAFLLSLSLISSMVASLTRRQERQFAVLRALGASSVRIAMLHLGLVLVPGLAGVVSGYLLGSAAGDLLQVAMAAQLNIDIADALAAPAVRIGLLVVGMVGLLSAALVPLILSIRKPVREILQGPAPSNPFTWRGLALLAPIDRLAVAEAFARPGGTIVTMFALSVGGIGLIAATSTYLSLVGAVDLALEARRDTLEIVLADGRVAQPLAARLARIKGVQAYEFWGARSVPILRGDAASSTLALYSPPVNTGMGRPPVTAGRWPSNPGEVAVSAAAAGNAKLTVGQDLRLAARDGVAQVRIVGLVNDFGESMWTTPATFRRLAGPTDMGTDLRLVLEPARFAEVRAEVEQAVLDVGGFPKSSVVKADRRDTMVNHFAEFYRFLLISAIAAAVVGAVALSATVASNTLERTREIGVLRALGGHFGTVARLVAIQSLALTLASLVIAIGLALPLSAVIVDQLSKRALYLTMPLQFSLEAIAGWSLASVSIAVAASVTPALRLVQMSIRAAVVHE